MLSKSEIKQNLFNLLTTKDFKITLRDKEGQEVTSPQDALVMGLDKEQGDKNYGTEVLSICL